MVSSWNIQKWFSTYHLDETLGKVYVIYVGYLFHYNNAVVVKSINNIFRLSYLLLLCSSHEAIRLLLGEGGECMTNYATVMLDVHKIITIMWSEGGVNNLLKDCCNHPLSYTPFAISSDVTTPLLSWHVPSPSKGEVLSKVPLIDKLMY